MSRFLPEQAQWSPYPEGQVKKPEPEQKVNPYYNPPYRYSDFDRLKRDYEGRYYGRYTGYTREPRF